LKSSVNPPPPLISGVMPSEIEMNKINENILEFKRKLAFASLERQNSGLTRANNNCDSVKKWLVTVWFGTVGFAVNKGWKADMLFSFLMLEILTFYFIDVQYRALIKAYKKKIEFMEDWLIRSADEDLLNLNARLETLFSSYDLKDRISFIRASLTNKYTLPVYIFLTVVSAVISMIFS
jgi:hypothetical protein